MLHVSPVPEMRCEADLPEALLSQTPRFIGITVRVGLSRFAAVTKHHRVRSSCRTDAHRSQFSRLDVRIGVSARSGSGEDPPPGAWLVPSR